MAAFAVSSAPIVQATSIVRCRTQRLVDATKATEIAAWADLVATAYNVLPMDGATFRTWARLMHRKSNTFYEDAMIASTAIVHDLTIVTRNITDFEHFDVSLLNPFEPTRN